MRHHGRIAHKVAGRRHDLGSGRCRLDHGVADTGERFDEWRYPHPCVHQALESPDHFAILQHDDGYLGGAVAHAGRDPGRLKIDDSDAGHDRRLFSDWIGRGTVQRIEIGQILVTACGAFVGFEIIE